MEEVEILVLEHWLYGRGGDACIGTLILWERWRSLYWNIDFMGEVEILVLEHWFYDELLFRWFCQTSCKQHWNKGSKCSMFLTGQKLQGLNGHIPGLVDLTTGTYCLLDMRCSRRRSSFGLLVSFRLVWLGSFTGLPDNRDSAKVDNSVELEWNKMQ